MVIAVVAVVFAFAFCYCEGASAAIAVGGVTLPLEVDGRWIRDAEGDVVSLSCANWYGSDQKDYVVGGLEQQTVDAISSLIASEGFNCVRLPCIGC
ncbi:hypothetical protein Pelo_19644 [Pelomyxa schiedti]|nr:hypothetical protein Pelo_19644 [Pelomyxa schiedti]